MSLDAKEYAKLARDSYHAAQSGARVELGGSEYRIMAVSRSSSVGFQGTAYRAEGQDEVIIAFRGTEFDREPVRDGAVDAAMVLAGMNPQLEASEVFTRQVLKLVDVRDRESGSSTHVTVTGHSLGGTLAQLNGAKFGLDGQTFNAYGAQNLDPDLHEGRGRIVNHCRAGDPVCAAADHIGTVKVYATQGDIDRLKLSGYTGHDRQSNLTTVKSVDFAAHGIENFVDGNAINGASILGPESQARYRANQSLVDMYRSDIHFIRERASASWEVPDAIGREIQHTATRAAEHVQHGAVAFNTSVALGALQVFEGAGRVGRNLGEGAHIAGERAHDYVAGRAAAVGKDLHGVADDIGERVSGAARFAAYASPLTSPAFREQGGAFQAPREHARLDEPAHPAHGMFKDALHDVHQLDAQAGRQPDQLSTNLAASLTAAAREQGMSRIDDVKLSKDASWAYAVQGSDNDLHKKIATVATELGIAASVEQSSAVWREAVEREATTIHRVDPAMSMPAIDPTAMHPGIGR